MHAFIVLLDHKKENGECVAPEAMSVATPDAQTPEEIESLSVRYANAAVKLSGVVLVVSLVLTLGCCRYIAGH